MAGKSRTKEDIKCIAVHLPVSLAKKLDEYKARAGKSKNTILVEFIEKGLSSETKGER
jgi:predicted DNA-binding protein